MPHSFCRQCLYWNEWPLASLMYGILHPLLQTPGLSCLKQLPELCRQNSHTVPTPLLWAKPAQGQGACSLYWCTRGGLSIWPSAMTQQGKAEHKASSKFLKCNGSISFNTGGYGVEYHTAGNVWERREKKSCIYLL